MRAALWVGMLCWAVAACETPASSTPECSVVRSQLQVTVPGGDKIDPRRGFALNDGSLTCEELLRFEQSWALFVESLTDENFLRDHYRQYWRTPNGEFRVRFFVSFVELTFREADAACADCNYGIQLEVVRPPYEMPQVRAQRENPDQGP